MINAKITDIPVPVTRTEHFMYSAITGNESGLKADTQAEMYLDAIKNSDTSDLEGLEPRTVLDMYLEARQTGNLDDLPKPRTTSEMLLYQAITGEDLGAKPVSNMDKYLSLLEPNNYDARLEIESEESVIHLTDSKDGVVEVKELEGNTMVNYVADGVKESTLNGDIDVEGTNVTLTEGVDNGKVDVALEGNTLVNLIGVYENVTLASDVTLNKTKYTFTMPNNTPYTRAVNVSVNGIKPNTEYTIIANITKNTLTKGYLILVNDEANNFANTLIKINPNELGIKKHLVTSKNEIPAGATIRSYLLGANEGEQITIGDYILFEGDWTDKEIPPYFEGMKSVAECEDNKIEILSRGKNLFDKSKATPGFILNTNLPTNSYDAENLLSDYIPVKPNTKYFYSFKGYTVGTGQYDNTTWTGFLFYTDSNEYSYIGSRGVISASDEMFVTSPSNAKYIRIGSRFLQQKNVTVQFVESDVVTEYTPYVLNKKEITLSKPLRALPGGVKDKVVKVGGKWYVERNCIEILLDGLTNSGCTRTATPEYNSDRTRVKYPFAIDSVKSASKVICDKLIQVDDVSGLPNDVDGISTGSTGWKILLNLPVSLVGTTDESMNAYLQQNNLTIIAELDTPIYEELEVEPTLNTYTDVTHISNNSTIPCNMKVKNDEHYKCILKPSTLYTVAFDTNNSGTVGVNLGGSKVTTNNNVVTVTTPSTLTDDTLRLTGKGIKASNVRLLEGDKTNWIPSFFEGMKSSFEDKLQDDGTYKMEILSRSSNVITLISDVHQLKPIYSFMSKALTEIEPYLKYFNLIDSYANCNNLYDYYYTDNGTNIWLNLGTFNKNEALKILNDRIAECMNKSNKIQFSSIEPLRGVGDVKDRLCIKDGRLVIERKCGSTVINILNKVVTSSNYVNLDYYCIPKPTDFIGYNNDDWKEHIVKSDAPFYSSRSGTTWDSVDNINRICSSATHNDWWIGASKDDTLENMRNKYLGKTIIYQLKEPTYEEITPELQKLILKCYDNATLYFNTNIPPKSLISYTANTSNIYKYLDTLKLSKAERDSIINSMKRV